MSSEHFSHRDFVLKANNYVGNWSDDEEESESESELDSIQLDLDVIAEFFQNRFELADCMLHELKVELKEILAWGSERRKRDDLIELLSDYDGMEYFKAKRIGSGAFGEVFEGYHRVSNDRVALKIIDLEDAKDDITTISKEIHTLAEGKMCPQLVNYLGSVVVGTKLWIVMEYVEGGSVHDQIKRKRPMFEDEIAIVCRETLLGLAYLISEGRVHRDIKGANILLSKTADVKLGDFGASGQLTETMTKMSTFVGSPYFMAPEVITEENYNEKADIWSLGITVIEMATGNPPYVNIHPTQMIQIIAKKDPPRLEGDFSKTIREFVRTCLQRDPDKRPTIHRLLKHPFITSAKPTSHLRTFVDLPDN
uniref:non-specific serine/threonine protein kinase n=1 Tax=Hirondellea gigas TaxID=1518452 RepID=A0A6A7G2Z5_9CRUS